MIASESWWWDKGRARVGKGEADGNKVRHIEMVVRTLGALRRGCVLMMLRLRGSSGWD
jgi:hypothetical protein